MNDDTDFWPAWSGPSHPERIAPPQHRDGRSGRRARSSDRPAGGRADPRPEPDRRYPVADGRHDRVSLAHLRRGEAPGVRYRQRRRFEHPVAGRVRCRQSRSRRRLGRMVADWPGAAAARQRLASRGQLLRAAFGRPAAGADDRPRLVRVDIHGQRARGGPPDRFAATRPTCRAWEPRGRSPDWSARCSC